MVVLEIIRRLDSFHGVREPDACTVAESTPLRPLQLRHRYEYTDPRLLAAWPVTLRAMFFNAPLWKQQAPLQDGSFRPQRPNRAPLAIARYAEAGPAETDLAYSRKISTKFEFAGFFARISRGIKPIVAVRRDSIGPARRPACSHTCLFSPGFTPIRTLTAQRVYLGQRLSPARLSHHSRGMRMESSPLPMPPCAATPARARRPASW